MTPQKIEGSCHLDFGNWEGIIQFLIPKWDTSFTAAPSLSSNMEKEYELGAHPVGELEPSTDELGHSVDLSRS